MGASKYVFSIQFFFSCINVVVVRTKGKGSNVQTNRLDRCIVQVFSLSSNPVSHIRAREFQGQDQYDDPHTCINTMPAHHQYTVTVSQYGQNVTLS